MHPAHFKHPTATRAQPSEASRSPEAPYFPEGGVAAPPFMIVNPLSKDVGNGQPNELAGPATADWQIIPDSHAQGQGVPAFKKWPRQFHSEAYAHDRLWIMPFPDQVGPIDDLLRNRPEKAGWSVPTYSEQYEQPVAMGGMGSGVANLRDPATAAYATGWGYVG
jgi:hypothetical protein